MDNYNQSENCFYAYRSIRGYSFVFVIFKIIPFYRQEEKDDDNANYEI